MINHETGAVTCEKCGEYLGNYMSGDYFKMIKTKYCPHCKATALNEQKRLWAREKRQKIKREKQLLKEQNDLLKQENEILRERLKELRK